ncbi:Transcription termination factor 2 [Symbiodinium microadriaticum]|uniref:Transcription termination factor 2 n=1 Tax=Symbiodinium microadriaticum TaxID=2951 RepID=A0A1Q9E6W1_SYMMI|nr:Transcription termination factor 2 [Symbiodinium microadriaticum]
MDVELVDDDNDDSNGAHWDTQVAELASLLDISTSVAAAALQQSFGCFELAVDLACDLNAVNLSAAASSEPSASSRSPAPQASARPHPSEPSAPLRPAAPPREEHGRPAEPSAPIRPAAPQPRVQDLQLLPEAEEELALEEADEALRDLEQAMAQGLDSLRSARPSVENPTKRRHLEMPSSGFHIPNNSEDAAADNPPLFRKHPLRDEQLRSLGWMLSQEALPKSRRLRGGLLADRMGFGKTSVAIGLASLGATLRPPRRKESLNSGFVPSLATLIMCPSHLLDQWKGEFWKFLGEDGVQISTPQDPVLTDANSECIKMQFHIKDFPPENPEKQKFHLGMEAL